MRKLIFIMLLLITCFFTLKSWGAPGPNNEQIINKITVLKKSIDQKMSNIEKELSDAKSRDIGLKDKAQQDQKDFYHGSMVYFNIVFGIATLSVVFAGWVGFTNLNKITNEYNNKLTSIKEIEKDLGDKLKEIEISKNMLTEFEANSTQKLNDLDSQFNAFNEFMLGQDILRSTESNSQSIENIAIPCFEHCVKLLPSFELASIYLAIACKQIGDFRSSFNCLWPMQMKLSTAGTVHLLESAIFMGKEEAIKTIEQFHKQELDLYGNGKFMPFMRALQYFVMGNYGAMKPIIEKEVRSIDACKTFTQGRIQFAWSFNPVRQFLEQKSGREGFDEMMEYVDYLEGVSPTFVSPGIK